MNIIHKLLLVLTVAAGSFEITAGNTITLSAKEDADPYPMACKAYEVDNVNSSGGFDKVSCHNQYSSALDAMKQLGDDGVVRHISSLSPTKIIAMNSGMAFAYPFRGGSSLLVYYQDPSFSSAYATTYSGQHYQMKYFETVAYDGSGSGTVRINLNGFEGYAQLKNVDLVPLKFFTDGLTISLGGNETFYNTPEEPFSLIPRMNTFVCVRRGNYKELLFNSWYGWSEDGVNAVQLNRNLSLPAAEWMTEGTVYYSYNGTDYYTDQAYKNFAGQYFNYYQFLPLRTKTEIKAETFDAFLKANNIPSTSKLYGNAQAFIDAQNEYGVNALMIYAMACLESAYGTSYYAINRNNFFGWSAYDTNPNEAASFKTVEEGIRRQMSENLAGYLDMNDWRFYGSIIGNKGSGFNLKYASAVYWGMQIASIAYRIDKLSCNEDGNLTDYNRVNIGIVKDSSAYASLTKGGKAAYDITSANGRYVPIYPVAVLSEEDGYYKTQCTNYVVDGKLWFIKGTEDVRSYDWENSVGWFAKDAVELINTPEIPHEEAPVIGEAVETLDALSLEGTVLKFSGSSFREGVKISEENQPSVKLVIENSRYEPAAEIAAKTETDENGRVSYNAQADLADLTPGTYFFRIAYEYAAAKEYSSEFYLKTEELPEGFILNQRAYEFAKDSKNFLSLTIAEITCGAGTHYDEEAKGCIVDVPVKEYSEVPEDDMRLMRGVDEITFDEKTKTVKLNGLAFFKQMDARAGEIVHELVLVNTEKDQEYALSAATNDYDGLMKGSPYDLSDVGFEAELDLNEIESGNYYLRIRTINPERTGEGALFSNLENSTFTIVNDHGETVRFFANPLSNYRLEVSVEKQSLSLDDVKKPSRMTSLFGYQSLKTEDSHLKMDGLGILYQAAMRESDQVAYRVHLQDEEGNLYSYDAGGRSSNMDFAPVLRSSFELTYVSFDLDADLSELPCGTYRMYLEITTSEYHDLFEMYSITSDSYTADLEDGRKLTVSTTDVRSRYELTISEREA